MARLRLAVGAGTRLEAARLPGAVVAVSTKNIGRRVSHGGLREARHEALGRLRISLDRLLKQNGRDALVVAADVRVVAQHRRPVDREPRQHADALAVRRPLEPQQRERLVDVVGVLGALLGGVGEVRPRAAVEVGVGYGGGAEVEEALVLVSTGPAIQKKGGRGANLLKRLMRPLDRQHRPIHHRLITLLIKPQTRHLRQQVVEPRARPAVRVRARHGDVGAAVHGVRRPQRGDALEDAVAQRRVARLRVEHEVHEARARVADLADDEGAREDALPQAGADLVRRGVAGEVDLDDGAGDVGFADAEEVLVAGGGLACVKGFVGGVSGGRGGSELEEGEEGDDGEEERGKALWPLAVTS